jgi:hypothetical protein
VTATLEKGSMTGVRAHRIMDANVGRTLAVLLALLMTLPVDIGLVLVALLSRRRHRLARPTFSGGRTVLLTGGKMTKALQLARSFHFAGHRVILVESEKVPADRPQVLPRGGRLLLRAGTGRAGLCAGTVQYRPIRKR